MTELNRRSFLVGLFGTAVVAAAGPMPTIVEPIDLEAWAKAVAEIYGRHVSNIITFGISAIRHTEKFPFIELVEPEDMTLEQLKLFNQKSIFPYVDELSDERRAVSDIIAERILGRKFTS